MSDKSPGNDNLHSLGEFFHAKKVVEDFPKILSQFHRTLRELEKYKAYTGVWDACCAIEEAETLMLIQLEHFQDVLSRKGKI